MTDIKKETNLRTGLTLTNKQIQKMQQELDSLLERIPSRLAVLFDTSGQLVTLSGEMINYDYAALGSLIASELAASQETARLLGDTQDFRLILREGERTNLVIAQAGQFLTFMVLYTKEVPIGWARKMVQRSATRILEINLAESIQNDEHLKDEFPNNLPDLFNDALDDLLKG
jgi:predicted regulator of Ras-like GTPase activity (Roadblock/LC7/MglB family)